MGYFSANDTQLYYEICGDGPPLLLVMGLGGNTQIWAPIRRHLASHFRLIMYDMQGTGRSPALKAAVTTETLMGEINGLLAHLGLNQVQAVGYSFGAAVLLTYAHRFQTKVKSISLVSGTYAITPYVKHFFDVQATLANVLDRRLYLKQIIFWLLSEEFFQRNPEFFERAIVMIEHSPLADSPFNGWEHFAPAFKSDYREELAAISCPFQVIHGTADKISPVDIVIEEMRWASAYQLDLIEKGSHMLIWDRPEAVMDRLMHFLAL